MSDKPNVLVLMCDQMQAGRMGFVDGIAHTPNLDALAGEGVHFTHAVTAQGQCVPARAVFQTGLYAHECGVMINYGFYNHQGRLSGRYAMLGREFADAGYRTAYIGKGHFGVPATELGYAHDGVTDGLKSSDEEARKRGRGHVPPGLRSDYAAADAAVDYLKDYRPDERPLFLMFSTNLPHPPFFREEKFADRFPPDSLPIPKSFYKEDFAGKPPYQRDHVEDGGHGVFEESAVRSMLSDYYSMIAAMDEHFGRVIGEFKRLGLWDNTIVLFFADHGDMMGAHKMLKKGTLPYDELYRIPCIMKLPPGAVAGRRVIDDLVCSVQFPATLLRLAGLEPPPQFRHGDLCEALERQHPPDDEAVFYEHYAAYWGLHPFYAVRTREWKYVRYYGPDATEELYHLASDPDELRNLAEDGASAATRVELAARADEWWRQTDGRDVEYYESDYFRENRHNLESAPWAAPDAPR